MSELFQGVALVVRLLDDLDDRAAENVLVGKRKRCPESHHLYPGKPLGL